MKKMNLIGLSVAAAICLSGQSPNTDTQSLKMTKNSKPSEKNVVEEKEEQKTSVAQAKRIGSARKVVEGIVDTSAVMGAAKKAVQAEIEHRN